MTVIEHYPDAGLRVLRLDCGCWLNASDHMLDAISEHFSFTPERLLERLVAQHEHEDPPRAVLALFVAPEPGNPGDCAMLRVVPGCSAPVNPRPPEVCS